MDSAWSEETSSADGGLSLSFSKSKSKSTTVGAPAKEIPVSDSDTDRRKAEETSSTAVSSAAVPVENQGITSSGGSGPESDEVVEVAQEIAFQEDAFLVNLRVLAHSVRELGLDGLHIAILTRLLHNYISLVIKSLAQFASLQEAEARYYANVKETINVGYLIHYSTNHALGDPELRHGR